MNDWIRTEWLDRKWFFFEKKNQKTFVCLAGAEFFSWCPVQVNALRLAFPVASECLRSFACSHGNAGWATGRH
jgi:hypothetical protein